MTRQYSDTIPPPGKADGDLDMVLAGDALNRLRELLHGHRIYPSISYFDGIRLHVANEMAVRVRSDDDGLFYCWTDERQGASREEFEAPAYKVDDVASQIAAALYKVPDARLTP
ncbi:hypothetical protein OG339_24280 [Streptosporangium sp. NBC_01495]|uniref:hypothetical protein n=1 Tax=Streptosporangium sp. NBC_01495 TaxID=2903899 RepID=UPI002E36F0FA|nr:hypothetical protein [Streptosporangium sp. NBC_01495]